ncbi:MBL fold metallo-hydrolase [Massilia sp. TS11]|uniref:MBL fold metallo-hydrolase n=1 Tax=Massilia sp. TS11 TaxID=2908003 RepID=UPI001EDC873D|nr:MBL fold metallo-hydrolase [Massilia sp. TS11]MCG2585414.1 MBL fold metallo-hydrolase [Massilia sp. TS11]
MWRSLGAAVAALSLAACSLSTHPLSPVAAPGVPVASSAMERLLDTPGPIQLESVNTADWQVPLAGLLNLDHAAARRAGLRDHSEAIQVYTHVLRHPVYGNFLVDTGVARRLAADPGGAGLGWLVARAMALDTLRLRTPTEDVLAQLSGPLQGVLFTHLHLDHISGLPAIPANSALFVGPGEARARSWQNLFVRGSSDALLNGKAALREFAFRPDPDGRFDGVLDVFGDASLFAISVPGHTPGSVAYVVRTPDGPVLLAGDTCHTRWGWEHAVGPGDFTADLDGNQRQLERLLALAARHPAMRVRLGHQP